ncbi:MAG TPA: hypothetical protein VF767_07075, partial [Bryobacteraceae bacterium]
MARKKEAAESVVVDVAKAIGGAAGKIAAAAGVTAPPPRVAKAKVGKLPKKNKARLPRRQKKAQKKARSA